MCGHSSRDVGDGYETPTLEDLAAEIPKFPRYELEDGPESLKESCHHAIAP